MRSKSIEPKPPVISPDKPADETATKSAVAEEAIALNTLEEIAAPSLETESEFTRRQMASLFGVTYEAVRQWEESGEIEKKGWEVVPESKTKKPRRYRKITG